YIYLWFGDKSVADEKTPEEYGAAILALAENIRTVCPESMVLAMSYPPLPEEYGSKSDELNEMLHMYIRSTPDEYVIYRNFSYAAENADGYLAPEYGTEEINAAGISAMLNAVEHDRFYSDMTSDSDEKYEEITASRPEYTVTDGKVAYLTFDDGPSKYTPQILDILRENDIKATFFITGWCIDGKEHILKQVADEGHTIALHSYSHDYDKIYASRRAWLDDFAKVYGKVYAVTGQKPWAFRFPGGSYNSYNRDTADGIIAEMQKRGFAYYDWNAATADASSSATYDSCMDYLQNSIDSDHEVVLMHDSLELTPQYLQDVIDYIKDEGYSFETIDAADEVHF
ncbi:MAG: polysaccharide deacetylase family protein, partial [Oscillospiraceae bacterium]|nr:polysaccharide deacetylase family protein [Oscillospiraceae bacterium]